MIGTLFTIVKVTLDKGGSTSQCLVYGEFPRIGGSKNQQIPICYGPYYTGTPEKGAPVFGKAPRSHSLAHGDVAWLAFF